MGRATKAQGNPYYIARMRAAEVNDDLSSREGAADVTGIERTRLARIELGTIVPYPDEVRMLADAYTAPELMNYYCSHDCQIGGCMGNLLPVTPASSLSELACQAAIYLRNAGNIRDQLINISADGIISEDERPILETLLEQLGHISQVARQLQAIALKIVKEE